MRARTTTVAVTAALTLAGAVTSCQASDRAGGNAAKEVVTLAFAQYDFDPPVQLTGFADEVEAESRGSLKIDFKNRWRFGEATGERGVLRDIRDGKVAMGWVGARVFDQVGLSTFQPLLAPLLVDSQDLQQKVFEAGIPDEMLAGVTKIGLVGVAVFPGPMQKLLSNGDPLTTPAALAGLTAGIPDSRIAKETFTALGATTVTVPGGGSIADVDAYGAQLEAIRGNHYEAQGAKSVVGNLNLWPRALVIVANKRQWSALSADQQSALRAAARGSLHSALEASRAGDTDNVEPVCLNGIAMPQATEVQRAAFEKKLAPVYDEIAAADPRNKDWLEQIRHLKTQLGAGPDTARCEASAPEPRTRGGLPDGTYETTLLPRDIRSGCRAGEPGSENLRPALKSPRTMQQAVLKGNSVRLYAYPGGEPDRKELAFAASYRVYRDKLALLEDGTTEPLVFTYSFDGTTLRLSNLKTPFCDHVVVWTSHPWVKVDTSR